MSQDITLIYCAAANRKYAEIAQHYGLQYGAQLPNVVYFPPYFVDQDYNNPDRDTYISALQTHRPVIATVLDWDMRRTREEVLSWAAAAAQYVSEAVIIIPKIPGTVSQIPRQIFGKQIRLGYYVETSWGRTSVPLTEFLGWPVHLLGGSLEKQLRLSGFSPGSMPLDAPGLCVASADGNYTQLQANQNRFFTAEGRAIFANNHWPMLSESVFGDVSKDTPYLAFELSMMNLNAYMVGCRTMMRFAVETDLPAIKRIANQYKSELGYVMSPALREGIKRRNLVVAEYQGVVVDFINYRACRDGWQTIYEIAVDKSRRGEYIGAGLLSAVPKPIRLKCTVDNPANNFYERMGLKHMGEEAGRKRALNIWNLEERA